MLCNCRDLNCSTDRLGLFPDGKFDEPHCDLHQISGEIDCILDRHGGNGQCLLSSLPNRSSEVVGIRLMHPPVRRPLLQIGGNSENKLSASYCPSQFIPKLV